MLLAVLSYVDEDVLVIFEDFAFIVDSVASRHINESNKEGDVKDNRLLVVHDNGWHAFQITLAGIPAYRICPLQLHPCRKRTSCNNACRTTHLIYSLTNSSSNKLVNTSTNDATCVSDRIATANTLTISNNMSLHICSDNAFAASRAVCFVITSCLAVSSFLLHFLLVELMIHNYYFICVLISLIMCNIFCVAFSKSSLHFVTKVLKALLVVLLLMLRVVPVMGLFMLLLLLLLLLLDLLFTHVDEYDELFCSSVSCLRDRHNAK